MEQLARPTAAGGEHDRCRSEGLMTRATRQYILPVGQLLENQYTEPAAILYCCSRTRSDAQNFTYLEPSTV